MLGLASTTHGFAYALMEDPGSVLRWANKRTKAEFDANVKALDALFRKYRPHAVAFEIMAASKKRSRGQFFARSVISACRAHRLPIVSITEAERRALAKKPSPTKWDVAVVITKNFPELAHSLPARRKIWDSEDDRIGIFMAVAAATIAWRKAKNLG